MINIEIESEEWFSSPAESCVFCDVKTRCWNRATNEPVCIFCAAVCDVNSQRKRDIVKTVAPW